MRKILLFILFAVCAIKSSPYIDIVQSIQPTHLIQYLPMNETSGTTAYDSSGNGRNGTYTATCTLNVAGLKDGEKAVKFNGSNAYLNTFSASYANAFSGSEGSLMLWFKSDATPWGGVGSGGVKVLFKTAYNGSNFVQINATNSLLQIYNNHKGVPTLAQIDIANIPKSKYSSVVITWSMSDCKIYFSGARVRRIDTTYAGWDSNIQTASTVGYSANAYYFNGNISNLAIWNKALTKQEVDSLHPGTLRSYSAVCFGNSITSGSGASTARNNYVNRLGKLGFVYNRNQGIPVTILQNTPASIFSNLPQTNNGRDRFDTSIIKYGTDYVFILYGLNDLRANDTAITVNKYKNDLSEIVTGLIDSGFDANKIVLGSPPYIPETRYNTYAPFDGGSLEKHQAYVTAVSEVADSMHTYYADVYTAMLNNGARALLSSDSIHPNDSGHAVIANAFYNAIADITPNPHTDTITLVCSAENALTYQWYDNNVAVSGATDSVYTIYADSVFYSQKQVIYCVVNGTAKYGEWRFGFFDMLLRRWAAFKTAWKSAFKSAWK